MKKHTSGQINPVLPFRYCKRCQSYKARQYSRTLLICDNCGCKTKMSDDETMPKKPILRKFKERLIVVCEDNRGNIGCHHKLDEQCDHYCHSKTYEEIVNDKR